MATSLITPEYQYIAFIDESGDPGLAKVFPTDADGASEWLCLSAVVINKSREADTVEWVRDIRMQAGIRQGPALHFRRLTPDRKRSVCQHFAQQPLRGFVVCSHKANMRQHRNRNAEKIPSKQWFYNWCVRVLLERVTDWCERRSRKDYGEPRRVKVVFSERGGHSYSQTRAYHFILKQQATSGTTYLGKRVICPEVVDWNLVEQQPHQRVAGLQIADTFVSAFYQAADSRRAVPWTTEYAKLLRPRMAREPKTIICDYGVTLLPWTKADRARLLPEQQEIFRYYGYSF